jgi:hypothetical protein
MGKKTLIAAIVVLLILGAGSAALLSRAKADKNHASIAKGTKTARSTGATKARSSKALSALLNPMSNVGAPIEDSALVAIGRDEQIRREQQLAGLFESAAIKFASLGLDLDLDPATLSEAKLEELEVQIEKTSAALDQAVEEILEDPDAGAFAAKVDAQLAAFEAAKLEERDAMIPELRGNLEKLVDQVISRAKSKIGR